MSSTPPPRRSLLADVPDPNAEEQDEFILKLEDQLGRSLKANESDYVEKVRQRFEQYCKNRKIFDHDLVRIQPRWEVTDFNPLDIFPEVPQNLEEFWSYLALAFEKKKLPYPVFLKELSKSEPLEQKYHDWEKEREINTWSDHVARLCQRPPIEGAEEVVLRIIATGDDARLQILRENPQAELEEEDEKADSANEDDEAKPAQAIEADDKASSDGETFETLEKESDFETLAEELCAGLVQMDSASTTIWLGYYPLWKQEGNEKLDFNNLAHASFIRTLLELEELEDRILTLDEEPFMRIDSPLQWHCEKGSTIWRIKLFTTASKEEPAEAITHSLRYLPGPEPLYLSDDALFIGPQTWKEEVGSEGVIRPNYEIPVEVLETAGGIEFLSRLGATLPESLEGRIRDSRMQVQLQASVENSESGSGDHFYIEVAAAEIGGADPARQELLIKEGWQVTQKGQSDGDDLKRYDRHMLYRFPALLQPLRVAFAEPRKAFRCRITRNFPERFAKWAKELPPGIALNTDEEIGTLLQDPLKATVQLDLQEAEQDWFDLKVVVNVEGGELSQKEIKELVDARGEYVRLQNRGWLRLELDLDEKGEQAFKDLGVDPYDLSGKSHRMHTLQLSGVGSAEVIDAKAWKKIQERAKDLQLKLQPDVPSSLQATLRPYQRDGFHFLVYLAANNFGGILADDMGLGKTMQSLAYLLWLREEESKERKDVPPALVVCPKSVIDVWGDECRRHAPHLKVQLLRNRDELDLKKINSEVDLLVINYAQMRGAIEELKQINFLVAILDEGQQIKNPDSKAAKAARELSTMNRLVLSGTPIENSLLDVWSLMAFAMPGVLGDRKYFRDRFDRRKDPEAHRRLSSRLRPFLLRRRKAQVAQDLPPRTEEILPCEMDESQATAYQNELGRARKFLLGLKGKEELNKNRFHVLSSLLRLRQICCHPSLAGEKEDAEGEEIGSAKLDALFYLLNQLREEGHKALVFSQFTSMLDIIRARLDEEDRDYLLLTGQTENRRELVREFQNSDDPLVFLLSLKAGGSGLNLTAASYVILYDPWWNPAVEQQAIDRTHRIGQTKPVMAYRLITRNTVEEKIRLLQEQKEDLIDDVLSEESFSSNLSMDDLQFLLADEGVNASVEIEAEELPELDEMVHPDDE